MIFYIFRSHYEISQHPGERQINLSSRCLMIFAAVKNEASSMRAFKSKGPLMFKSKCSFSSSCNSSNSSNSTRLYHCCLCASLIFPLFATLPGLFPLSLSRWNLCYEETMRKPVKRFSQTKVDHWEKDVLNRSHNSVSFPRKQDFDNFDIYQYKTIYLTYSLFMLQYSSNVQLNFDHRRCKSMQGLEGRFFCLFNGPDHTEQLRRPGTIRIHKNNWE